MIVVIFGPRDCSDKALVKAAIKASHFDITEVVSGGAAGVDALGEDYSRVKLGKEPTVFKADWDKYGRGAGHIRNAQMANYAEAGIGIDFGTPGSRNMIEQMRKLGKPCFTISDAYEV